MSDRNTQRIDPQLLDATACLIEHFTDGIWEIDELAEAIISLVSEKQGLKGEGEWRPRAKAVRDHEDQDLDEGYVTTYTTRSEAQAELDDLIKHSESAFERTWIEHRPVGDWRTVEGAS